MNQDSTDPGIRWTSGRSMISGIDAVFVVKRNTPMTSIITIAAPTPAPNPPGKPARRFSSAINFALVSRLIDRYAMLSVRQMEKSGFVSGTDFVTTGRAK